jgi:hypothetical protein
MSWRRTSSPPPVPPQPQRPRVFLATVDTLPQPYELLGLVHASEQMPAGQFATNRLLDALEDRAAAMGADGVIGIQVSQAAIPGMSRERLLGRVTDHFGGVVMATAMGTAIRMLPPAPRGRTTRYAAPHAR